MLLHCCVEPACHVELIAAGVPRALLEILGVADGGTCTPQTRARAVACLSFLLAPPSCFSAHFTDPYERTRAARAARILSRL